MKNLALIQVAYAHEEGATTITVDNTLGPILTLIIIILAVVVAKRINPVRKKPPQGG